MTEAAAEGQQQWLEIPLLRFLHTMEVRAYCSSSALHLLARLLRTRSVGRLPYEDSDRKILVILIYL